jgi:serine/threonine protein kinase/ketosteroid isomerase-like protein
MKCEKCGTENDGTSHFCQACGTPLSAVDFKETAVVPQPSNPEPSFGSQPVLSLVGRTVDGRYHIDSVIDRGGMGVVYRATRMMIGDVVALKVLHGDRVADTESRERFRREAQAAARLKHPNAVTIYDFGVASDGLVYLVMEFVEGESLAKMIKRQGALPLGDCLEILRQITNAIGEAHRLSIVHRDLKPDNVIVRGTGSKLHVKVLDFGIAKLRDVRGSTITQTGMIIGTPHYMSPEQCLAEELDGRSDIYSLGVILFEMLTGKVPFDAATPTALVIQQVTQPAPSPRISNPSVSIALERVVLRALEKKRDNRPVTAEDFYQEVATAVGGAPDPARPGTFPLAGQPTDIGRAYQTGGTDPMATPGGTGGVVPNSGWQSQPGSPVPLPPGSSVQAGDAGTGGTAGPPATAFPGTRQATPGQFPGTRQATPAEFPGGYPSGPQHPSGFGSGPQHPSGYPSAPQYPSGYGAGPQPPSGSGSWGGPQYPGGPAPYGSGYQVAPAQAKSRTGLYLAIVIAVIVLVGSGVVVAYFVLSNQEGPSTNQNKRIQAGTTPAPTQRIQASAPGPGPGPITVPSLPVGSVPSPPSPQTPIGSGSAVAEVNQALNGWAQAISSRNASQVISHYSHDVKPYKDLPRAPIEVVQADWFRDLNQYSKLDVQVSNVSVEPDPDGTHAIATFDKSFDFSGTSKSSGKVQEQMWFTKVGGQWLISGLKDLKTY